MCGYLGNQLDSPLLEPLVETLGIQGQAHSLRDNPGTGPAASIDLVIQGPEGRTVAPAIWWLLLDRQQDGSLKPSRYTSFNTRSDKLNVPRSAGFQPYRSSRCVIPATYIIEGEGAKGNRKYHKIAPESRAFALGGLYRRWVDHSTGEELLSCSVVTLPPHPKWAGIHSKSTPLFLPVDDGELVDMWLDPSFTEVGLFESLLTPELREGLVCTPVVRPGDQREVGQSVRLTSGH